MGVAGNTCSACHTEGNFTLSEQARYQSIPGHARWSLAPIEMAWEGKSLGEICAQLKDRTRNGGRDLALLHEHFAKDDLV
ncbi:MAG TPA: Isoquinoline 1-oxidoreductase subunit, partial [Xanthobacteraceae bacterium]|nr:Isoquinoline 1-oxidoreductase subunit [Xanthobacteraceae bacterium]